MAEDDDSLFITLYTDADVHGELAKQVRGRGFKARSAYEEKQGNIVSERLPLGELLRRILRLLNRVAADEMRDNLKNLGEFAEHPAPRKKR